MEWAVVSQVNVWWVEWTALSRTVKEAGMVVHAWYPSTWDTEAGGSWVWDWLGLKSEALSQNREQRKSSYGGGRDREKEGEGEGEREGEGEVHSEIYSICKQLSLSCGCWQGMGLLSQKQSILLLITQQQLHGHIGSPCLPSPPRMKLNS